MILSDPKHNIIVQSLRHYGMMSVKQLGTELELQGHPIKLSQLYNIVGKLEKGLFIYKKKSFYLLHPAWISELESFSMQSKKTNNIDINALHSGKTIRVAMKSFIEICTIWPYYASIAFHLSGAKEQRRYCQHHAYSLSMLRKKIDLPQVLHPEGVIHYDLCYNDTFLDTYSVKIQRVKKDISIAKKLNLFDFKGYNISIIGDYLIEFHLGPFVQERINSFFAKVTSLKNFDVEELRSIVQIKENTTLYMKHSPQQANLWREKIKSEII